MRTAGKQVGSDWASSVNAASITGDIRSSVISGHRKSMRSAVGMSIPVRVSYDMNLARNGEKALWSAN